MPMWDAVWINANLATMVATGEPYGAVRDGAVATEGGAIVFAGPMASLPAAPASLAREVHDAGGAWITPGLVG